MNDREKGAEGGKKACLSNALSTKCDITIAVDSHARLSFSS